jgi:hypothetical protein
MEKKGAEKVPTVYEKGAEKVPTVYAKGAEKVPTVYAEVVEDTAPTSSENANGTSKPCDISRIDFLSVYAQNLMRAMKEAGAAPLIVYATIEDILGTFRKLLKEVNPLLQKILNPQTIEMFGDAILRYGLMRVSKAILEGEYDTVKHKSTEDEYKQLLKRLLEAVDWKLLLEQHNLPGLSRSEEKKIGKAADAYAAANRNEATVQQAIAVAEAPVEGMPVAEAVPVATKVGGTRRRKRRRRTRRRRTALRGRR